MLRCVASTWWHTHTNCLPVNPKSVACSSFALSSHPPRLSLLRRPLSHLLGGGTRIECRRRTTGCRIVELLAASRNNNSYLRSFICSLKFIHVPWLPRLNIMAIRKVLQFHLAARKIVFLYSLLWTENKGQWRKRRWRQAGLWFIILSFDYNFILLMLQFEISQKERKFSLNCPWRHRDTNWDWDSFKVSTILFLKKNKKLAHLDREEKRIKSQNMIKIFIHHFYNKS